jgi:hypothetical protein
MGKRDVIISALACGGKMSCRKQAAEFEEPPAVISINSSSGVPTGGGTVQGFRQAASALKTKMDASVPGTSVLQSLFDKQKVNPRRVALVSFLDGWSFIHEVLKTDDAKRIDTIIVLDGLNTRSIQPWFSYLDNRCLKDNAKLWLACSHASHKTAKSLGVGKRLTMYKETIVPEECHVKLPEYITNPDLGDGVSIYSKDENPKTKIFHEDMLRERVNIQMPIGGGFSFLGYLGKSKQDQTYVQQYVQPRLWRRLRELWKDPTNGRAW